MFTLKNIFSHFFIADDNALWKFSIRGCFRTKPVNQGNSIKLHNLDKTPPTLLEVTLRAVYDRCFGHQVTRTNVTEYKREPRLTSPFGKWLLFNVSKVNYVMRDIHK